MADLQTTATIYADESSIPAVTQAVYNKDLLTRAYPFLVHDRFGQRKPLSQSNGKSMVFRRYERLSLATTPLQEGVTPTGTGLDKTDVVATIKQYGNWIAISDLLDLVGVDNTIRETSKLLGENMGETLDVIYRDILCAGTQVLYVEDDNTGTYAAAGTALTDVNGALCKQALDTAINQLDRQNARKFTSLVEGADKDNTWPLAPAYWAIIHPDVEKDLYNETAAGWTIGQDFTPVEQYSKHTDVMPNEVGKYRSIRFVTTTHAKLDVDSGDTTDVATYRSTSSSQTDVYHTLIFGQDAYGIVPLKGGSARTIIHRAGGTNDPLNQRNTIAWKSATTAVILNDYFMYRICTASLL